MSSAMVSQTVQGAALSIASNVLAQGITSYKEKTPFSLNIVPVVKFAIFSVVSNPPNIIWQSFLEDLFPTNVRSSTPPTAEKPKDKPISASEHKTRMSKRNVLIKFILDQSFGAVLNVMMFLVFMGYVNADTSAVTAKGAQGAWNSIAREVKDKFYPMIMDGYKFWPLVSLVSFLWVPVDKRVVFGCSVGVLWGIYLSLMVDA